MKENNEKKLTIFERYGKTNTVKRKMYETCSQVVN